MLGIVIGLFLGAALSWTYHYFVVLPQMQDRTVQETKEILHAKTESAMIQAQERAREHDALFTTPEEGIFLAALAVDRVVFDADEEEVNRYFQNYMEELLEQVGNFDEE